MPKCFSSETIVQDKFIFVSYSHEDKPLVTAFATSLLEQGVRLWYDEALEIGDKWKDVVEQLLRHENCCGVILFCSPRALLSENVAKERAITLEEQRKRGEAAYPLFAVNISDNPKGISYMQLLKNTFAQSKDDLSDFKLEMLQHYMDIVGSDPICVMSSADDAVDQLLRSIKSKIRHVINKANVMMEKIEESTQKGSRIQIQFGCCPQNGVLSPITWYLLFNEGELGVLLSKEILAVNYGRGLEQWLNNDFKSSAFTSADTPKLCGDIRLLSSAECERIDTKLLCKPDEWWLSDTDYNQQMVVCENGSIYTFGYNNSSFKRGVRPVIVMRLDDIQRIIDSQT